MHWVVPNQRLAAAAFTFSAASSTRVTPLIALALATALSCSAWVATVPLRLTTPLTVSTLISVPGTFLVAISSAFTLVVIQLSVTGSLESWRSAWVMAEWSVFGGVLAAGSLARAAVEDSAKPRARAEASSVRVEAPLIQHTPGLALHSVVSSQRDTLLRQFIDVHVHATPQAVFDDPAVDAVVIATPNEQHAPLAIAALAAGKHVLVDKPFALDVAQAEAVQAAARGAGRIATVFQNRRFDADFLTLQRLLSDGTLGSVAECHAHFDRFRPQVRDRWREQDGPGSGLWYGLGPHLLDQMLVLFGMPQAIDADLAVQRDGSSGIDYFHAVLQYPRHRAIVHAGSLVAAPTPRFAVHGSAGSWIKHGLDVQEAQLRRGGGAGCARLGHRPAAWRAAALRCRGQRAAQHRGQPAG